ncbi:MAG: Spy/CpxP family protein refolding chaperone [Terriglobales bacterium]
MTRRLLTVAGVLVIAMAGAVALYGHGQRGRYQGQAYGDWWHQLATGKLQERLKLSSEQVDRIKEIAKTGREKFFQLSSSAAENRQALMKELFRDKPDANEINRRIQALQQVQASQLTELVNRAGEVNKVLTPEQRTELQRIMAERAQAASQRREHRRERWMQRNAPPAPEKVQPGAPEPQER